MKEQCLNLQFVYGNNSISLILCFYGHLNMTYFLKSNVAAIEFHFTTRVGVLFDCLLFNHRLVFF